MAQRDSNGEAPAQAAGLDDVAGREYQARLRNDMVLGSLWTLAVALTIIPINFAVNLILAHSLGPAGLGTLATYTAIFAIVTMVADLGRYGATIQWLAEAKAKGWIEQERELIRRCAGYHCMVAGPISAIVAVLILYPQGTTVCLVGAAAVWISQILGTSAVVLTATARNATAARVSLFVTVTTQATVVSIALATHSPAKTFVYPLAVTALGGLVTLAALDASSRRAVVSPRLSWADPDGFRRYGYSACAGWLVGTLVFGRSEVFVLKAHGLDVATGLFALATGLASQITVPMDSLMAPLLPTVAGLYAATPERALPALQRSLRVTSALGAITACTVVPALFELLPWIYGHQFSGAQIAFGILGFVSCLQSVTVPIGAFAFATRSAGAILRTDLICLAADALLALTLIPLVGLYGAVTANAVAQVLSLILMTQVVTRRLNIRWVDIAAPARVFVVGPIIGTAAIVVANLIPVHSAFAAAIAAALGLLALRVALALLPAIRLHDSDLATVLERVPKRLVRPLSRLADVSGLASTASTVNPL